VSGVEVPESQEESIITAGGVAVAGVHIAMDAVVAYPTEGYNCCLL